jgi:hypothetical protein
MSELSLMLASMPDTILQNLMEIYYLDGYIDGIIQIAKLSDLNQRQARHFMLKKYSNLTGVTYNVAETLPSMTIYTTINKLNRIHVLINKIITYAKSGKRNIAEQMGFYTEMYNHLTNIHRTIGVLYFTHNDLTIIKNYVERNISKCTDPQKDKVNNMLRYLIVNYYDSVKFQ